MHSLAIDAVDGLRQRGILGGPDRVQVYSLSVLATHAVCADILGWADDVDEDTGDVLRAIQVRVPSPVPGQSLALFLFSCSPALRVSREVELAVRGAREPGCTWDPEYNPVCARRESSRASQRRPAYTHCLATP